MLNGSSCVFCSIVRGEKPSFKIYEDEKVIAILDINPATPGHTLIISKTHFDTLEEASKDIVAHLFTVGNEIGKMLKAKLGAKGYNILANVGRHAGQVIFHVHIHIVPRYEGDGIRFVAKQKRASDEDLKKIYHQIVER